MSLLRRKKDHLRIVIENDVQHQGTTLMEQVYLDHCALPETNLDEIDISCNFFGKTLSAPIMITGMTGGAETAGELNRALAQVASQLNIAFGVGSQRVLTRHPEWINDFAVREQIPNSVLLGNIGVVQLAEYSLQELVEFVKMIDADGLCVHLNPAQELVQGEKGQTKFKGLGEILARLYDALEGRLVVKETGAGISQKTARKLKKLGIKNVDVSGSGGTSWTKVEYQRADNDIQRSLGQTFADWGIPTALSVAIVRKELGNEAFIIASGGLKNGLDAAKSIAMGADIAGYARPVLVAFSKKGIEGAYDFLKLTIEEFRATLFLTGSKDIEEFRMTKKRYGIELKQLLKTYGILMETEK